jgi:hypothetical protein
MPTWKRTRKRTRTKYNRVTYAPPQTQDGLGREEAKLSFSTPAVLTSTGKQLSPLAQTAIDLENEWSQKYVMGTWEAPTKPLPPTICWKLDPPPLTTIHPSRITDSKTRITLREHIQGSNIITHEGLTTLTHPNLEWTITSGTWNTLRSKWGLTSETLQKIYDSCKIQRQLETTNIFTLTRHIVQTIKRVLQVEGIHGLPAVAATTFFPKA